MGKARPMSALAGRLKKQGDLIVKNVLRLQAQVAKSIAFELVPGTPVRTGRARGNWVPTLNAPAGGPYMDHFDPRAYETQAWIAAIADQVSLGDTIFIVNRVPYVPGLNRGASGQAPPGYIQAAIAKGFDNAIERFSGKLLKKAA